MGEPPLRDPSDENNEAVFTYRLTKDRKVLIAWHNTLVTTLKGRRAEKFIRQIAGASDSAAQQLVMARFTGNFKRGNERRRSC